MQKLWHTKNDGETKGYGLLKSGILVYALKDWGK